MAITSVSSAALKAYAAAQGEQQKKVQQKLTSSMSKAEDPAKNSFTDTITESLKNVNDMQNHKDAMIESFAAGKNENVHELMISLQKAGLAMNLTSTVRNKVMTAYQEIMRMPM